MNREQCRAQELKTGLLESFTIQAHGSQPKLLTRAVPPFIQSVSVNGGLDPGGGISKRPDDTRVAGAPGVHCTRKLSALPATQSLGDNGLPADHRIPFVTELCFLCLWLLVDLKNHHRNTYSNWKMSPIVLQTRGGDA